MLEMYEKWEDKEFPTDKATKIRIYNLLKDNDSNSCLKYTKFE